MKINGADIKKTLSTVTAESFPNSLWEILPEMVAGSNWKNQVVATAEEITYLLDDDREYSLDDLRDLSHQYADGEIEDYYININRRVQDLSLWASDDLDQEVQEMNSNATENTLNSLNSLYLFAAMHGLFEAIAEWAINESEAA